MWCEKCQADVAAEVSGDTSEVHCATCHTVIRSGALARASEKTRQARELLERWSTAPLPQPATLSSPSPDVSDSTAESYRLDPAHPSAGTPPKTDDSRPQTAALLTEPTGTPATKPLTAAARTVPASVAASHSRKDVYDNVSPEPTVADAVLPVTTADNESFSQAVTNPSASSAETSTFPSVPAADASTQPDSCQPVAPARPAYDPVVQTRLQELVGPPTPTPQARPETGNLQSFWGQMLAYAGVLTITVGAVMVLVSYFGNADQASYAPTGWLIATTGQMLMFLGITTFVSGGLEQTSSDVSSQVETLNFRIAELEHISSRTLALLESQTYGQSADQQHADRRAA